MATSAATPPPAPTADANNAEGGKKSKKKLILIAAIVAVLLLIGGGAGWYFLAHKAVDEEEHAEEAPKKKKKAEPAAPPVFVAMDPFTINLQPTGQFLQVSFSLQFADQHASEELKAYMPQIRSRLLLLLSSKTVEEISTVDGKDKLVQEIMDQIKTPLASGMEPLEISNVFITSFVIQ